MNPVIAASRAATAAYKAAEKQNKVDAMFTAFKRVKDKGCRFGNGEGHVKRDKAYCDAFIATIIAAVKKFEPWIAKEYEKHGGLQSKHVLGYTLLGRYLCDGDSPIYKWWSRQAAICPTCYREYGQPYFAINCKHDDSIPEWKQ